MNRTLNSARASARLTRARAGATAIVAVATLGLAMLAHATTASASTSQFSIIQDGNALFANPPKAFSQFRALGPSTVRYLVFWKNIAPNSNSSKAPKNFKAGDPAAYPKKAWDSLDSIVRQAKTDGVKLDLDLVGPPPNWAQGTKNRPKDAISKMYSWNPNAADYGSFVHAVAERYDGKYKAADGTTLPRVSFWSIWNEPNFGQDLGPQAVGATSKFDGYSVAPGYYRNLVGRAWSGLHQTGHAKDTILIGEFAAEGRSGPKNHAHPQGLPGNYAQTVPLQFVRSLYCVDKNYKALSGTIAKDAGCPTGGARRSFVKDNPALFGATGVSIHPYASNYAPNSKAKFNPDYAVFPVINRLGTVLDNATRADGHKHTFPLYSTEYGYITNPPQPKSAVKGLKNPSPAQAAIWLNQAEYLSYKNPRIRSYSQYLLDDPPTIKNAGLFASGLYTSSGKPKPALNAYRLPLWMPSQKVKRGKATVWGGARPAEYAFAAAKSTQKVKVQEKMKGSWKTIATPSVSKSNGYFDTKVTFNSSGSVRLAYTYPKTEPLLPLHVDGSTIYSRTINVTVK